MKTHEESVDLPTTAWSQGRVVAALLHLDANRPNTAVRIARDLRANEPRHPHVRSLVRILNELGLLEGMATEPTKMTLLVDSEGDWMRDWPILHTVPIYGRRYPTMEKTSRHMASILISMASLQPLLECPSTLVYRVA